MSLRIKHINGDSSFLLIFSPPYAHSNPQGTFPGSFSILVDPWVVGASTVLTPKFSYTTRTIPACIESLCELPEPDAVIVSQDKSDHCHQQTLTQLPSDTNATIYGPAAAIKRIAGWKHFAQDRLHVLPRWEDGRADTIIRIPVPAPSVHAAPGEVTITFLAPKVDLSGLHNAVCITYRPPSTVLSPFAGSHTNLPQTSAALTPPSTPPSLYETSSSTNESITTSSTLSISHPTLSHSQLSLPGFPFGPRERAISVLYSPHGLPYSMVKPFASRHLLTESALPLTALFHSFDRVNNPWYLGGNISAGSQGGIEIAKGLSARCWISAHDEEKTSTGVSTKQMKIECAKREDIQRILDQDITQSIQKRKSKCSTTLVELDAGAEHYIPATR